MSYDKADWHLEGEFPKDLPSEQAGTHIGMFLAWVIMNGLEGEELQDDSSEALAKVRARKMSGRQFLFSECDGKLWDQDLNQECNEFAKYYYYYDSNPEFRYLEDYHRCLASDLPSTYHVEDTWGNYDKIAEVISMRFRDWKRTRLIQSSGD